MLLAAAAMTLSISVGWPSAPKAQQASPFAALPTRVESPADNPSTPEKVALGRMLFSDRVLSRSGDTA
jgi:cytochrome c peroxidase